MTNRLSKKRREQIELLQCAADVAICGERRLAMCTAAQRLGMPWFFPRDLLVSKPDRGWWICGKGYEFCLLEAAQRIAEGRK